MQISHVMLRITDMDRAVGFYRDAVGLEVLTESAMFSFFDAGSIKLALTIGEPPPSGATTEIVMEVDDVMVAFGEMQERGVAFEVEPRAVMGDADRELHAAHFRDPDGHLWSITGWVRNPGP